MLERIEALRRRVARLRHQLRPESGPVAPASLLPPERQRAFIAHCLKHGYPTAKAEARLRGIVGMRGGA